MIQEVGRALQREKGIERPTGDFGLELVGGVKKGSVQVNIALTRDMQNARATVEQIIGTVNWLAKMGGRADEVRQPDEIGSKVVRHLNRIAEIQRTDKTEMRLELRNGKKKREATFGEAAVASTEVLRSPQFQMGGITLYGKLFELRDTSPSEDEGEHFWGELKRDNDETWRIQFKSSDISSVVPLFRKQVAVSGTAFYYPVQTPKLVAETFGPDTDRDYEAAFDELYGCNKELYGAPLDALLEEIRGDV
ncbi:MAG: hypothetical protein ACRD3T_20500 [Terriglobia bacterium]